MTKKGCQTKKTTHFTLVQNGLSFSQKLGVLLLINWPQHTLLKCANHFAPELEHRLIGEGLVGRNSVPLIGLFQLFFARARRHLLALRRAVANLLNTVLKGVHEQIEKVLPRLALHLVAQIQLGCDLAPRVQEQVGLTVAQTLLEQKIERHLILVCHTEQIDL